MKPGLFRNWFDVAAFVTMFVLLYGAAYIVWSVVK